MRALARGDIGEEIKAALPKGAERWPHTNGSSIRDAKGETEGDYLRLTGVVLHYDIMRVFETRVEDYGDDPALAGLTKADTITVVLIRPPAEDLATQIARKARRRSLMRRILKRVEDRVSRLLRPDRASVYSEHDSEARHQRLAKLYQEPDFLPRRYVAWREFLERTAGKRLVRPILEVEPASGGFRLVDRPGVYDKT